MCSPASFYFRLAIKFCYSSNNALSVQEEYSAFKAECIKQGIQEVPNRATFGRRFLVTLFSQMSLFSHQHLHKNNLQAHQYNQGNCYEHQHQASGESNLCRDCLISQCFTPPSPPPFLLNTPPSLGIYFRRLISEDEGFYISFTVA